MRFSQNIVLYTSISIAIIGIIVSSYLAYIIREKSTQIESLLQDRNIFLNESRQKDSYLIIASTTIKDLQTTLENTHEELENLADDYRDEKDRNEEFEGQIRHLAGTLGDLDKLAKTDEELLQKYSKIYFLNENYIPERLKEIDDKYILSGKKDQYFHASAIDKLEDLLEAAKQDNLSLKIVSAYRSFDEQIDLKGQYTEIYGSGANTFSADQGYSEHQLGTTVDLTTEEIGGTYTNFADTKEYQWLLTNAYKYGFILSYPNDNTFYVFEPWHWRYVGEDLARDLYSVNANFYDWDQREIDKYLISIFD